MIYPPPICGTLCVSTDILEFMELKLLMSLQEVICALVCWTGTSLGGGSQGRMSRKRLSSGPVTSTQQSGSVLPALRQAARELISDPSPVADQIRLLSFNRTQSKVVASFLIGHNTLSKYLYTMGLINSSLHRRKPQLTICVSVKIWRHSDTSIWVRFSWALRMLKSQSGAIWNFVKGTGLP